MRHINEYGRFVYPENATINLNRHMPYKTIYYEHPVQHIALFPAYFPVAVIPRGASSILIQEMGISPNNFLVLKDSYGKYQLNGNWRLNKEGRYNIKGTKFIYRRSYNRPESLQADGPLLEELVLEVK